MIADVLTKECRKNKLMIEVLMKNEFGTLRTSKNQVILGDGEIKIVNKTGKTE